MQVGNDGRHGKFPLEPDRQIQHDADHHAGQRLQSIDREFVTDLRTHEFGAAQIGRGVRSLERGEHLLALRGGVTAFLHRHADQDLLRGPKVLHLHVVDAQRRDAAAHPLQVRRLGVAHLHQRAAGELHRQMQAFAE